MIKNITSICFHSNATQSRRLNYKAFYQQHSSSAPYMTHKNK